MDILIPILQVVVLVTFCRLSLWLIYLKLWSGQGAKVGQAGQGGPGGQVGPGGQGGPPACYA